ncbi:hemagglutinin, partial [Neisseria meningitidis]|nr:hemagglutinin [Neisseria meningitidis]
GGILAGSGTSLAAPYLDKAAENLGTAGKAAVNALGGAAIGYAAGGNVGTAAVGANVDWNNRQLHLKEMALADKYAEALKREVEKREGRKISSQEAAMRIRRQILRWVDKGSQDGYTDQTVISTIGMKGEDKALGYTWDYRNYGARNPQAYNDPKLFEEYRRQDKPEYRNLTWLHSGTKDTKIRQGERKNEEFALNVADGLTSLVNPNPRIKAPILAAIRNPGNIKPTVTGSDPLLAGAGNIRIPANGNVAKGDRIPDTALASKSHQKNDFGTSKGQGAESSIPVPQAISIKIKNPDKTVSETTYQSNPKHTPGQLGFKFDAGIEPKNSVQLIESSVQIGKQRFAIDDKGHIHRYMGGDRKNEPWHWAGSTSDKKNPLSLTSQQKAGIKRAYPEQSKNKLLK